MVGTAAGEDVGVGEAGVVVVAPGRDADEGAVGGDGCAGALECEFAVDGGDLVVAVGDSGRADGVSGDDGGNDDGVCEGAQQSGEELGRVCFSENKRLAFISIAADQNGNTSNSVGYHDRLESVTSSPVCPRCAAIVNWVKGQRIALDNLFELVGRQVADAFKLGIAGAIGKRDQFLPRGGRLALSNEDAGLAGLHDGGGEGNGVWRSGDEGVDDAGTSAFAEDGDTFRVTTKGADVALDPVESQVLVEKSNTHKCQLGWIDK